MDIKKILLVVLIAVAVVASVSAVSAWLFDSGKEVTVNGINFHLPEEFDVDNL